MSTVKCSKVKVRIHTHFGILTDIYILGFVLLVQEL
jgi:hypothetical protein